MLKRVNCFRLKFILVLVAVLALIVLVPAGCGNNGSTDGNQNPNSSQGDKGNNSNQTGDGSDQSAQNQQKVTLYFSDEQAMYLLPEERTVTKGHESLEAAVIQELINGPGKDSLVRTIPEDTKLISISVVNGVANVNFSKEFQSKHWGGSAGETMTLYSVVNSLCELPGIEKVQFLLEGEKKESILNGNMDTTVPIEPDYNLIEN
ncbi:Sporulation and spore germination [Sporotomaculum syntrophicum]|uniref:Sporulation and spore germination n=1 Tax=Sporotomaculum syntrophicum TaxID=182264 RepID=A0A9D3AXN8_9FIRM|nr:GerMN domain-containing protein [Sporotomaculum syntrophicum]KAF1083833.1 Sporulation and spore germination [Sporotomaculum syntrophicum]